MAYSPYDTLASVISLIDVTIRAFSTLLNEHGFLCYLLLASIDKRRKRMSFSEQLNDENMIMGTLTIFLGILLKECHKVQDVVKKKTIDRQDNAASDSSQSK